MVPFKDGRTLLDFLALWSAVTFFLLLSTARADTIELQPGEFEEQCATYCSRDDAEGPGIWFEPGSVYVYSYRVKSTSFVNGTTGDYDWNRTPSGPSFAANVLIRAESPCELTLELKDVRTEEENAEDDGGKRNFFGGREQELEGRPLRFHFVEGTVAGLCPSQGEQVWALNIKRGILSALQNSVLMDLDTTASTTTSTTIYEKDISGSCKTDYSIIRPDGESKRSSFPQRILVGKIKDLSNCSSSSYRMQDQEEEEAYYESGSHHPSPLFRSHQECIQQLATVEASGLTSEEEDGFGGGSRHFGYRFESSDCTETHHLKPFSDGDSGVITEIKRTIFLDKILSREQLKDAHLTNEPWLSTETGHQIEAAFYRTGLMYEEEDEDEEEIVVGESSASRVHNVLKELRRQAGQSTLNSGFSMLIKNLRSLGPLEIKNVFAEVDVARRSTGGETEWRLLLDAVPYVWTEASVLAMAEMSMKDSSGRPPVLNEVESENWFLSLAFIKRPTLPMVSALARILEDGGDKKAAALGISSLVHSYCSLDQDGNAEEETRRSRCDRDESGVIGRMMKSIVVRLGGDCSRATQETDRDGPSTVLTWLKALGNTGLVDEAAIETLRRCYTNEGNQMEVRLAAVQSLRRAECREKWSLALMEDIFADKEKDDELRLAGYLSAARCPPSVSFLKTVGRTLHEGDADQVTSFVWTHLRNLEESSGRWKRELKAAGLLENEILKKRFSSDSLKLSQSRTTTVRPAGLEWAGAILGTDFLFTPPGTGSSPFPAPRSASARITVNVFGRPVDLLEVGARVDGLDSVVENLFGRDGMFTEDTNQVLNFFMGKGLGPEAAPRNISSQKETPGGSFYGRVFGNELSFSRFEIPKMIENLKNNVHDAKNIFSFLNKDVSLDYRKSLLFLDGKYTVPTMSGFGLKVAVNGSATVGMKSRADIRIGGLLRPGRAAGSVVVEAVPSAEVEIFGSVSVEAARGVATLSRLMTVNRLRTGTSAKLNVSVVNGELVEVAFDLPRETAAEIINVSSELYVLKGGDEEGMVKMAVREEGVEEEEEEEEGRRMTPTISGLRLRSVVAKPRNTGDTAPHFLLSSPFRYALLLQKTDTFDGYRFLFRRQVAENSDDRYSDSVLVKFDTPGSKLNRRFEAFGLVDTDRKGENGFIRLSLASPFGRIDASGGLRNTETIKSFRLAVHNGNSELVSVKAGIETVSLETRYSWRLFCLLNAGGRLLSDVGGNIAAYVAPAGVKYSADLKLATILTQEPIYLSGDYNFKRKSGYHSGRMVVRSPTADVTAIAELGTGSSLDRKAVIRGRAKVDYWMKGSSSAPESVTLVARVLRSGAKGRRSVAKNKMYASLKKSSWPEYSTELNWIFYVGEKYLNSIMDARIGAGEGQTEWSSRQLLVATPAQQPAKPANFEIKLSLSCPTKKVNRIAQLKHKVVNGKSMSSYALLQFNDDERLLADLLYTTAEPDLTSSLLLGRRQGVTAVRLEFSESLTSTAVAEAVIRGERLEAALRRTAFDGIQKEVLLANMSYTKDEIVGYSLSIDFTRRTETSSAVTLKIEHLLQANAGLVSKFDGPSRCVCVSADVVYYGNNYIALFNYTKTVLQEPQYMKGSVDVQFSGPEIRSGAALALVYSPSVKNLTLDISCGRNFSFNIWDEAKEVKGEDREWSRNGGILVRGDQEALEPLRFTYTLHSPLPSVVQPGGAAQRVVSTRNRLPSQFTVACRWGVGKSTPGKEIRMEAEAKLGERSFYTHVSLLTPFTGYKKQSLHLNATAGATERGLGEESTETFLAESEFDWAEKSTRIKLEGSRGGGWHRMVATASGICSSCGELGVNITAALSGPNNRSVMLRVDRGPARRDVLLNVAAELECDSGKRKSAVLEFSLGGPFSASTYSVRGVLESRHLIFNASWVTFGKSKTASVLAKTGESPLNYHIDIRTPFEQLDRILLLTEHASSSKSGSRLNITGLLNSNVNAARPNTFLISVVNIFTDDHLWESCIKLSNSASGAYIDWNGNGNFTFFPNKFDTVTDVDIMLGGGTGRNFSARANVSHDYRGYGRFLSTFDGSFAGIGYRAASRSEYRKESGERSVDFRLSSPLGPGEDVEDADIFTVSYSGLDGSSYNVSVGLPYAGYTAEQKLTLTLGNDDNRDGWKSRLLLKSPGNFIIIDDSLRVKRLSEGASVIDHRTDIDINNEMYSATFTADYDTAKIYIVKDVDLVFTSPRKDDFKIKYSITDETESEKLIKLFISYGLVKLINSETSLFYSPVRKGINLEVNSRYWEPIVFSVNYNGTVKGVRKLVGSLRRDEKAVSLSFENKFDRLNSYILFQGRTVFGSKTGELFDVAASYDFLKANKEIAVRANLLDYKVSISNGLLFTEKGLSGNFRSGANFTPWKKTTFSCLVEGNNTTVEPESPFRFDIEYSFSGVLPDFAGSFNVSGESGGRSYIYRLIGKSAIDFQGESVLSAAVIKDRSELNLEAKICKAVLSGELAYVEKSPEGETFSSRTGNISSDLTLADSSENLLKLSVNVDASIIGGTQHGGGGGDWLRIQLQSPFDGYENVSIVSSYFSNQNVHTAGYTVSRSGVDRVRSNGCVSNGTISYIYDKRDGSVIVAYRSDLPSGHRVEGSGDAKLVTPDKFYINFSLNLSDTDRGRKMYRFLADVNLADKTSPSAEVSLSTVDGPGNFSLYGKYGRSISNDSTLSIADASFQYGDYKKNGSPSTVSFKAGFYNIEGSNDSFNNTKINVFSKIFDIAKFESDIEISRNSFVLTSRFNDAYTVDFQLNNNKSKDYKHANNVEENNDFVNFTMKSYNREYVSFTCERTDVGPVQMRLAWNGYALEVKARKGRDERDYDSEKDEEDYDGCTILAFIKTPSESYWGRKDVVLKADYGIASKNSVRGRIRYTVDGVLIKNIGGLLFSNGKNITATVRCDEGRFQREVILSVDITNDWRLHVSADAGNGGLAYGLYAKADNRTATVKANVEGERYGLNVDYGDLLGGEGDRSVSVVGSANGETVLTASISYINGLEKSLLDARLLSDYIDYKLVTSVTKTEVEKAFDVLIQRNNNEIFRFDGRYQRHQFYVNTTINYYSSEGRLILRFDHRKEKNAVDEFYLEYKGDPIIDAKYLYDLNRPINFEAYMKFYSEEVFLIRFHGDSIFVSSFDLILSPGVLFINGSKLQTTVRYNFIKDGERFFNCLFSRDMEEYSFNWMLTFDNNLGYTLDLSAHSTGDYGKAVKSVDVRSSYMSITQRLSNAQTDMNKITFQLDFNGDSYLEFLFKMPWPTLQFAEFLIRLPPALSLETSRTGLQAGFDFRKKEKTIDIDIYGANPKYLHYRSYSDQDSGALNVNITDLTDQSYGANYLLNMSYNLKDETELVFESIAPFGERLINLEFSLDKSKRKGSLAVGLLNSTYGTACSYNFLGANKMLDLKMHTFNHIYAFSNTLLYQDSATVFNLNMTTPYNFDLAVRSTYDWKTNKNGNSGIVIEIWYNNTVIGKLETVLKRDRPRTDSLGLKLFCHSLVNVGLNFSRTNEIENRTSDYNVKFHGGTYGNNLQYIDMFTVRGGLKFGSAGNIFLSVDAVTPTLYPFRINNTLSDGRFSTVIRLSAVSVREMSVVLSVNDLVKFWRKYNFKGIVKGSGSRTFGVLTAEFPDNRGYELTFGGGEKCVVTEEIDINGLCDGNGGTVEGREEEEVVSLVEVFRQEGGGKKKGRRLVTVRHINQVKTHLWSMDIDLPEIYINDINIYAELSDDSVHSALVVISTGKEIWLVIKGRLESGKEFFKGDFRIDANKSKISVLNYFEGSTAIRVSFDSEHKHDLLTVFSPTNKNLKIFSYESRRYSFLNRSVEISFGERYRIKLNADLTRSRSSIDGTAVYDGRPAEFRINVSVAGSPIEGRCSHSMNITTSYSGYERNIKLRSSVETTGTGVILKTAGAYNSTSPESSADFDLYINKDERQLFGTFTTGRNGKRFTSDIDVTYRSKFNSKDRQKEILSNVNVSYEGRLTTVSAKMVSDGWRKSRLGLYVGDDLRPVRYEISGEYELKEASFSSALQLVTPTVTKNITIGFVKEEDDGEAMKMVRLYLNDFKAKTAYKYNGKTIIAKTELKYFTGNSLQTLSFTFEGTVTPFTECFIIYRAFGRRGEISLSLKREAVDTVKGRIEWDEEQEEEEELYSAVLAVDLSSALSGPSAEIRYSAGGATHIARLEVDQYEGYYRMAARVVSPYLGGVRGERSAELIIGSGNSTDFTSVVNWETGWFELIKTNDSSKVLFKKDDIEYSFQYNYRIKGNKTFDLTASAVLDSYFEVHGECTVDGGRDGLTLGLTADIGKNGSPASRVFNLKISADEKETATEGNLRLSSIGNALPSSFKANDYGFSCRMVNNKTIFSLRLRFEKDSSAYNVNFRHENASLINGELSASGFDGAFKFLLSVDRSTLKFFAGDPDRRSMRFCSFEAAFYGSRSRFLSIPDRLAVDLETPGFGTLRIVSSGAGNIFKEKGFSIGIIHESATTGTQATINATLFVNESAALDAHVFIALPYADLSDGIGFTVFLPTADSLLRKGVKDFSAYALLKLPKGPGYRIELTVSEQDTNTERIDLKSFNIAKVSPGNSSLAARSLFNLEKRYTYKLVSDGDSRVYTCSYELGVRYLKEARNLSLLYLHDGERGRAVRKMRLNRNGYEILEAAAVTSLEFDKELVNVNLYVRTAVTGHEYYGLVLAFINTETVKSFVAQAILPAFENEVGLEFEYSFESFKENRIRTSVYLPVFDGRLGDFSFIIQNGIRPDDGAVLSVFDLTFGDRSFGYYIELKSFGASSAELRARAYVDSNPLIELAVSGSAGDENRYSGRFEMSTPFETVNKVAFSVSLESNSKHFPFNAAYMAARLNSVQLLDMKFTTDDDDSGGVSTVFIIKHLEKSLHLGYAYSLNSKKYIDRKISWEDAEDVSNVQGKLSSDYGPNKNRSLLIEFTDKSSYYAATFTEASRVSGGEVEKEYSGKVSLGENKDYRIRSSFYRRLSDGGHTLSNLSCLLEFDLPFRYVIANVSLNENLHTVENVLKFGWGESKKCTRSFSFMTIAESGGMSRSSRRRMKVGHFAPSGDVEISLLYGSGKNNDTAFELSGERTIIVNRFGEMHLGDCKDNAGNSTAYPVTKLIYRSKLNATLSNNTTAAEIAVEYPTEAADYKKCVVDRKYNASDRQEKLLECGRRIFTGSVGLERNSFLRTVLEFGLDPTGEPVKVEFVLDSEQLNATTLLHPEHFPWNGSRSSAAALKFSPNAYTDLFDIILNRYFDFGPVTASETLETTARILESVTDRIDNFVRSGGLYSVELSLKGSFENIWTSLYDIGHKFTDGASEVLADLSPVITSLYKVTLEMKVAASNVLQSLQVETSILVKDLVEEGVIAEYFIRSAYAIVDIATNNRTELEREVFLGIARLNLYVNNSVDLIRYRYLMFVQNVRSFYFSLHRKINYEIKSITSELWAAADRQLTSLYVKYLGREPRGGDDRFTGRSPDVPHHPHPSDPPHANLTEARWNATSLQPSLDVDEEQKLSQTVDWKKLHLSEGVTLEQQTPPVVDNKINSTLGD